MKKAMKRCCRNQATQLIFLVIFIPAMLLPIALPMAGALAGYENWTFDEAFEFVICGLLRMALPTGPARDVTVTIGNVTTTEYKLLKIKTTDGQICEVFIGVCSLTTFGFILNKINSFKFGERIGKTIGGICSSKVKGHDQKLMVEVIIMTFITYPILLLIFAMLCGDIMAAYEKSLSGVL